MWLLKATELLKKNPTRRTNSFSLSKVAFLSYQECRKWKLDTQKPSVATKLNKAIKIHDGKHLIFPSNDKHKNQRSDKAWLCAFQINRPSSSRGNNVVSYQKICITHAWRVLSPGLEQFSLLLVDDILGFLHQARRLNLTRRTG